MTTHSSSSPIEGTMPCICSSLHIDCDPNTCPEAALRGTAKVLHPFANIDGHEWALVATLKQLKLASDQNCETCSLLLNGLVRQSQRQWGQVAACPEHDYIESEVSERDSDDGSGDEEEEESSSESVKGLESENSMGNKEDIQYLEFSPVVQTLVIDQPVPSAEVEDGVKVQYDTGHVVRFRSYCKTFYYNFFTDADKAFSQRCKAFPTSRAELPFDTGSEQSFTTISNWMEACADHKECSEDEVLLPKRLVDVGKAGSSQLPSVHLCEFDGRYGQYATLSHCWGDSEVAKTTCKNLEARKLSIEWTELSQTFQDAIRIVRALGIQFIWIDSFCIIQDDAEDWRIEALKMQRTYHQSYVTISANHAASGQGGCFNRDTEKWYAGQKVYKKGLGKDWTGVWIQPQLPHDEFSLHGSPARSGHLGSPIFYRGWTLQERLLASRVIHYTTQELVWECNQSVQCQCTRVGMQEAENIKLATWACWNKNPSLRGIFDHWKTLIQQYTVRDLSYDSDKLVAIKGLATQFQLAGAGRYVAGLWETEFCQMMLWVRFGYTSEACRRSRFDERIAPSWSWASVIGPIQFPLWKSVQDAQKSTSCRQYPIQIVDVEDFQSQSKRTLPGAISSLDGHLTVSGQMIRSILSIDWSVVDAALDWVTSKSDRVRYLLTNPDDLSSCEFRPDVPSEVDMLAPWQKVTCVLWSVMPDEDIPYSPWKCYGDRDTWADFSYLLVLIESRSSPGLYRRIGMATLRWSREWPEDGSLQWPKSHRYTEASSPHLPEPRAALAEKWFKGVPERQVTIV